VSAFGALFLPDAMREAVSGRAWLAAMLEAERALANAEAIAGVIPAHAAGPIADACRPERFDLDRLAEAGRGAGNPVEPLVRELTAAVGGEAAGYVHWGATSQDILDTAAMLVARRACGLVAEWAGALADRCAELAREHRTTPMAARTLLQQAVPTTFGLKAAGWLAGVAEGRERLVAVRAGRLQAQLGGAAGTLGALGERGPAVLGLFARQLELAEPALPWHTNRVSVAELGSALAVLAGAAAKVGRDVVLLSQTEVAEVAEGADGGSSTMPHKRNPIASTLAIACAVQAQAQAGVLVRGIEHEHERAAGAWHAEWEALSGALAYAGGAVAAAGGALEGLRVDAARMRANLEATSGLVMAESLAFALAPEHGRGEAQRIVAEAAREAADAGRTLRAAAEAGALPGLSPEAARAALDPAAYLEAAGALVDRALERYATRPGGPA
jgi:3-carboxy-cis,cis-muconate cycloisomerase